MNTHGREKPIEEALLELAKLFKALNYYPPGHPSLQTAMESAQKGLSFLLDSKASFTLDVRRDAFLYQDRPVIHSNPAVKKLAGVLFSNRVKKLTFLPDLSDRDLRIFITLLAREPSYLQQEGGLEHLLAESRVQSIWVNEADLSSILAQREEMEAESADLFSGEDQETEALPEEEEISTEGLEELFERVRTAISDEDYSAGIREFLPLIRLYLGEASPLLLLEIFPYFIEQSESETVSTGRRDISRQALQQLAGEEILNYLVELLCSGEWESDLQSRLQDIISHYRGLITSFLMDRLLREQAPQARRQLTEALVRQESAALPVLREHLDDERWFAVRDAVTLLGEIRTPEVLGELTPLLEHDDARVRREVIRALARIGGEEATASLVKVAEERDDETSRQALLFLGAMKNRSALPILLKIAGRNDPLVRYTEIRKDAIKALGEIGSPEAIPTLVAALKRKSLWRRQLADEVRIAAAAALGEIGTRECLSALEEARDDRSADVARAAVQALKLIRSEANEQGDC